jgi:hypothetical protein
MPTRIVFLLISAVLIPIPASAAPAVPKVPAVARESCSVLDFPAPAFEVLIARPGQKRVNTQSPWLRIFFDLTQTSFSAFTFRFDNKYVTVYLDGIRSEKMSGSITFARVADGKDLKGTFELQTPDGEYVIGRFDGHWQKLGMLCGVGPHFP